MPWVELTDAHWFGDIQACWLVFIRVTCTCGFRSRLHLSSDAAANELIRHQVRQGIPYELDGS